jgi:hypothetical protein
MTPPSSAPGQVPRRGQPLWTSREQVNQVPVTRTNTTARRKPGHRLRPEPKLEIATETFSKELVLQLVDDCIVPALVDEFLRRRMNLPDLSGREHNVDQL